MPSPRPKPTALKIISGNPGKRPLPENEPKPKLLKSLRAPGSLSPQARKYWRVVVKQLSAAKIITELDVPALILYCEAYAQWAHAVHMLDIEGPIIKNADGIPIRSPYLTIADAQLKQVHKMLTEFGMTPSSRTKVKTTDSDTPKDQWDTL